MTAHLSIHPNPNPSDQNHFLISSLCGFNVSYLATFDGSIVGVLSLGGVLRPMARLMSGFRDLWTTFAKSTCARVYRLHEGHSLIIPGPQHEREKKKNPLPASCRPVHWKCTSLLPLTRYILPLVMGVELDWASVLFGIASLRLVCAGTHDDL
jgi:hypothetical protein